MRIAVVGATGNVGTSVVRSLSREPHVDSIVGIARRRPALELDKVEWTRGDVTVDDLEPWFRGADVVIHLAWLIQPSHDRALLHRVNVAGTERVVQAAAAAGVPALVYASSVGTYSAAPKDRDVDESWPTDGIRTSIYSVHKAHVERLLDTFEGEHPDVRLVRLRPALIFKREAASEIRRYFAGPLLPSPLVRRRLIPAVPDIPGLRFQAVHADDVAEAYRLAATRPVSGPFNLAAEPVLDPPRIAGALGARLVPVPARLVRGAAAATWRLRLQPTSEGWIDMALQAPIMSTRRAREELGWEPRRSAIESFEELLDGLGRGEGFPTPPLGARSGGRLRLGELRSGMGSRP